MMGRLKDILTAPPARHPFLFVRKVRKKLRGQRSCQFKDAYHIRGRTDRLDFLVNHLQEWAQRVPGTNSPLDQSIVFGQSFDLDFLLERCEKGAVENDPTLKGDIKLPWEFSRGYSFVVNALRCQSEEEKDACAATISASIQEWLKHNNDPNGVNWVVAMEVGIRAFNWVSADAVLNGRIATSIGQDKFNHWLWNHGNIIWERLEYSLSKVSNHYTADLLGLAILGQVFSLSSTGRKWLNFSRREMQASILLHQTHRDGGLKENSLPYHCLVLEMCLHFYSVMGGQVSRHFKNRVDMMCRVMADYRDSSTGDVFAFGDDDGGRIVPLDFVSEWGRADTLLDYATLLLRHDIPTSTTASCPQSGWAALRESPFEMAVDYGPVCGAHAHNDTLSFCLNYKGTPIFADPGSGIYTPDLEMRNRLRGMNHHSIVQLDNATQGKGGSGALGAFFMQGPRDSCQLTFCEHGLILDNQEPGQGLDATHTRTLLLDEKEKIVRIRDDISGSFEKVTWYFFLHPSVHVEIVDNGFQLCLSDGTGCLLSSNLPLDYGVAEGSFSPFYGRVEGTKTCEAVCRTEKTKEAQVNWELTIL